MNKSIKGGVLFSTILIGLLAYYFIWQYEPGGDVRVDVLGIEVITDEDAIDENGAAVQVHYLDVQPVIPDERVAEVGLTAPDFSYYSIDGREVTLSDYIDRKYVVLDFWGTTCPPCLMELPLLQEFYEEHGDQIEIIPVSCEPRQSANRVANVVNEKKLTFPVIHDPSGTIGRLYPTRAIPFLVFVDMDGTVLNTHLGFSPTIADDILDVFGIAQPETEPGQSEQPGQSDNGD